MVKKIELVWEDPAATETRTRTLGEFLPVLEQLKTKPKTWARIGEWDGDSGAYGGKKTLTRNAEKLPGKFTFEVRKRLDANGVVNGSLLYARYEGELLPKPA